VPLVADPNVSIHESKAFTCDVRPGRRGASHEGPTWLPVPPAEQTPLGRPERPGPMRAPTHETAEIDRQIVDAATIMDASRRIHDRGETT
jgi:hypothetical protein